MKRFMPLGTVVTIDLVKKEKIMIFSRLVRKEENDETLWDYSGCVVPLGVQGQEGLRFFNHSEIKRIVFVGLQDEEELQFSATLSQYYASKIEKGEKP